MRNSLLFALLSLTTTSPILAQETAASTTGTATATTPPVAAGGTTDTFAAPNGQHGAGLSISAESSMRMWGELSFYTTSETVFDVVDVSLTSFSLRLGGGYKISRNIELEGILPLTYGAVSVESNDPDFEVSDDASDSSFAVGNLHLGASYVDVMGPLRVKLGGAIQWGPWTIDPSDDLARALALAPQAYSLHDIGLWAWETVSLVTPAHVEFGEQFVGTGDGAIGLHIPTDGRDAEVTLQFDPGFGYYVNDAVLLGARLPLIWLVTESGDNAQVAIEPYGRFAVAENAFLNARFTVNIDEPLGFAFDEGNVWALHLGGGGTF
jgi:hypothetical protein